MVSLASLFKEFMPHGHCYAWDPLILSLSVGSDAIIALSYFSIPLALLYLVQKRKDLIFHRVFLLFAVFILACGLTHVMDIWNVWHGTYGVSAIIKAFTAVASVATAFMLFSLIPKAVTLPSNSALDAANQTLLKEVQMRKAAQEEVLKATRDLEQRVSQATETQKEALAQFQALADTIPQLVWVSDGAGDIFYMNQRWVEYTGLATEALKVRETRASLIHPDDYNNAIEIWKSSLASGEPYSTEYRIKDAAGNYHWFLARAMPLKDKNGTVSKWFGTSTNIHNQKNLSSAGS